MKETYTIRILDHDNGSGEPGCVSEGAAERRDVVGCVGDKEEGVGCIGFEWSWVLYINC